MTTDSGVGLAVTDGSDETASSGPYEAVAAYPDGTATVSRFARTAARCGFDGIVVRRHSDTPAETTEISASPDSVDIVPGVEVRAPDRSRVAGAVASYRDRVVVLCVHGGDPSINRLACEDPRVDVLAHPMRDQGDLNHVLARAAAENDVHLEFDLGPVLRAVGGPRVRALRSLRKQRDLVEKYDTPYVVSVAASSHLHLRSPRDLAALGEICGLSGSFVEQGFAAWGDIAARNRDRLSDSFIGPGIRRGKYEEDD